MRLTASFLWMCILLCHDCSRVIGAPPLKKMETHLTCGVNSTCGERTAQGQVCGCDWWCEVYGDCCPDYTRPDDGSIPPQEASLTSRLPLLYPSTVSCVDTRVDGGYLLVSTCPTHWKPDHVSTVCESERYGLSPAYVTPVTSTKSRLSYRNMFCAYCHGQTLYDIKLWHFSHTCDIEAKNMTFASMVLSNCDVRMEEPTRRACVLDTQDCRDVEAMDVRDDKSLMLPRDICHTYTDYVVSSTAVYKNAYCKLCHQGGETDTSPLECLHSHDGWFSWQWALGLGGKTFRLSRLAQFNFNEEKHTDYKTPAMTYDGLREEEANCGSFYQEYMYARNACRFRKCPIAYLLNGPQCGVGDAVGAEVLYCSPGWNAAEPPFRHTDMAKKVFPDTRTACENVTDFATKAKWIETEEAWMRIVRSWFEQTNYQTMYMSSYLPTTAEMFGKCESRTTEGTVGDTNAQLLAWVEHVRYHLTWPWIVNLSVTQGDGPMYLGEMSLCEMVQMCGTVRTSVGELGTDIRNVSFRVDENEYICEEALKSIERQERDERNERLKVFLKRAEMVHASSDCCTTTKMGIILAVMLLIWA